MVGPSLSLMRIAAASVCLFSWTQASNAWKNRSSGCALQNAVKDFRSPSILIFYIYHKLAVQGKLKVLLIVDNFVNIFVYRFLNNQMVESSFRHVIYPEEPAAHLFIVFIGE